jgi:hypothetical protein
MNNLTVAALINSTTTRRSWTSQDVTSILTQRQQGTSLEDACKSVGRTVASYRTCVAPKLKKIFEKVSPLPESEQGEALASELVATFK